MTLLSRYEWFVSEDGTRVAWHEKYTNAEEAAGSVRKARSLMQTILDDFVEKPQGGFRMTLVSLIEIHCFSASSVGWTLFV